MTGTQLQPRVLDPNKVKERLRLKQQEQKYHFDQHTKQLPVFEKREHVRVRMGNRWESGVEVDHTETPRSFKVQTDKGGEYCRNRKILMKLPVCGPASTDDSHFHEPPPGSVNGSLPCRE